MHLTTTTKNFSDGTNLPLFSRTLKTFELHTHAPIQQLIYHLNGNPFAQQLHNHLTLTTEAGARWATLSRPSVKHVILKLPPTIKIPVRGARGIKNYLRALLPPANPYFPTQTPAQAATTNYQIRVTPRPCSLALPLLRPPRYTNQLYTSSSDEQAYPPAYPSASTTSSSNIRPRHNALERSHYDWPASAWNKSSSIVAASKLGAYPARAARPTPVATSSKTGIFVLVFLTRYVITGIRGWEYGRPAYLLLQL
ncbi:hypothetical protein DFJ58DRAFT_726517 [Suillus subalutaceus]|uniref:uncharacterized protein n=1 Tax=Suillus subalutaceus TaxID=48586 RepID=UPI001B87E2D8|nr:uncharacterized protein DFJ58DRAFT_726517 [Suillus subalutaceus]KAG1858734.1 hypothetical protein DFJ58DRAFT_726517 [Suillus subalutaceus]